MYLSRLTIFLFLDMPLISLDLLRFTHLVANQLTLLKSQNTSLTHLIDVLVSLDEVDGQLPERCRRGVPEILGDARLHGLDIAGRGGHPEGAPDPHDAAHADPEGAPDPWHLLLGHQAAVQGRMPL